MLSFIGLGPDLYPPSSEFESVLTSAKADAESRNISKWPQSILYTLFLVVFSHHESSFRLVFDDALTFVLMETSTMLLSFNSLGL